MQRLFDILFSGIALVILSPLLLPLMLLLKLTGEGEIFFLQNRIGIGGVSFRLYKFATMLKNSPNMTTGTVTVSNDPRILPIGKFLRKTKINELPQLINIFKGDMSIIGPRPQTQRCFDSFPHRAQTEILKVRPGLSGIGSIIFRNEEELINSDDSPDLFYNSVVMPYKGALEEWYVSHNNIWLYFSLIWLTCVVILNPTSSRVWRMYEDLPQPNGKLIASLKYKPN